MLRVLGCVLAVIGGFVLLCTAGASDADLIGWDMLLWQVDVSVIFLVAGGALIYIDDKRVTVAQKKKRNDTKAVPYDAEKRKAE